MTFFDSIVVAVIVWAGCHAAYGTPKGRNMKRR